MLMDKTTSITIYTLSLPTLFRSTTNQNVKKRPACSELRWAYCNHKATYFASYLTGGDCRSEERSAGMPRPISYAVFCLKKKSWNEIILLQFLQLRERTHTRLNSGHS